MEAFVLLGAHKAQQVRPSPHCTADVCDCAVVAGSIMAGFLVHHRLILGVLLAIITVLLIEDCSAYLTLHEQTMGSGSLYRRVNT